MLLVGFCITDTSGSFLLKRDVRQGCNLSVPLFVIDTELVSRTLQKDLTIIGEYNLVGQKEITLRSMQTKPTVLVRDLQIRSAVTEGLEKI